MQVLRGFKRYVKQVLGVDAEPTSWDKDAALPFFLREAYGFFLLRLMGREVLLMVDRQKSETPPASIRKHMEQVQKWWPDEVVYVREQVTAYNRNRLVQNQIPFVVPNNQLYLPMLAMDHEGKQVCEWLNSIGVAGIILKYRLPRNGYLHPVPLHDAQQAIRTVRSRADQLNIKPDKIGIMGFSAGGHLASTAGTHFDIGFPNSTDPMLRISSRPDFMVLVYPVVTMKAYTHQGSKNNLLGPHPSDELVALLSNEEQVYPFTPPAFLIHTFADKAVPVENSVQLFSALRANGVETEMHIFQRGPHGFGMNKNDPILAQWPNLCADWMRVRGIIPAETE